MPEEENAPQTNGPAEADPTPRAIRNWMRNSPLRLLVTVVCSIILIAALRAAGDLFVPVLMGIFLAIVNYPILRALELRKIPRAIAIFITVAINILALTFILNLGTNAVSAFQKDLIGYFKRFQELAENVALWAESKGVEGAGEFVREMLDERRNEFIRSILQADITGNLGNMLASFSTSVVGKVAALLSAGFFVLIVMVFALIEGRNIGNKIKRIRECRGPDFSGFLGAADDVQRYIRIKTVASAATGLLAGLLCHFFGLEYAFLWGIVAFFLNFIPVVGSIIAGVLPVILALVQLGPLSALGVLAGYLLINFAIGNFIEPHLLGRRFGVSTLVIVLSVFFWGWMWGPLGMFLAVPLTMVVKVIFDNAEDFRWLSVAMGKGDVDEARILEEQEKAAERRLRRLG